MVVPKMHQQPYYHREDDSEDDHEGVEEDVREGKDTTLDMILQQLIRDVEEQGSTTSSMRSGCGLGKDERKIGASRGVRGPRQPRDKQSIQARRQFHCHVSSCDKAFTERRNLSQHLKTGHSDRRPFSCTVQGCNKSFKYKCVLDKHQEYCCMGPTHSLVHLPHSLADIISRKRKQPPLEATVQQQLNLRYRRTTTLSQPTIRALHSLDRSSALYRNLLLDVIIGIVG
ncbi:transcription factor iiia [Nannochloropsis oceanica]